MAGIFNLNSEDMYVQFAKNITKRMHCNSEVCNLTDSEYFSLESMTFSLISLANEPINKPTRAMLSNGMCNKLLSPLKIIHCIPLYTLLRDHNELLPSYSPFNCIQCCSVVNDVIYLHFVYEHIKTKRESASTIQ